MTSRHGHTALLILAVSVTALTVCAYAYLDHLAHVSADGAAAARQTADAEESDKSHQQDIIQLYQSTAAGRASLSGMLIPADQPVSFIESIESIGSQASSSVTLSGISADALDGASPGTIGNAQVHMDVQGSWSAVMRTLMLAEVLPYKTHIDSIRLDESGGGPGAVHIWKASFDLDTNVIAVASSTSQ